MLQLKYIRENIYGETINNTTYLRSKNILDLPSYCFFGLDTNDFSDINIDKDDIKYYTTTVTQQYFKDFSDNTTKELATKLPRDKKHVLVMITNTNEFF